MNADYIDSNIVPKWAWIIMATAFLLVITAIWWASSANKPERAKIDVSNRPPVDATRYTPPPVYRVMEDPPPQAFAQEPKILRVATVTVSSPPPSLPAGPVKKHTAPKQHVAHQPINSVRDMFPMGNVVDNLPRVNHPFRTPPELFPSFSYTEKLWSFVGSFAYSGQVDLVSIGYRVGDKNIYALADTKGPGKALFVQSDRDPDRFAIYR